MQHTKLYSFSGIFTQKSDLSLAALYWHVVVCEICGNHIMSYMFNSTYDEFENTKWIIRIGKSKKDIQRRKENEQTDNSHIRF